MLEQGDLIELDFDPTKGHEPAKRRPALVGEGHRARQPVPMALEGAGYSVWPF
ncbi:MAG: type II toxin-antitoxin system PemK/MazF family toxin [Coriobacteriales bacterium]|nr:type II toxin-antitoxin system PemK/MazF family toxin [Coriobacteriales bacterium]